MSWMGGISGNAAGLSPQPASIDRVQAGKLCTHNPLCSFHNTGQVLSVSSGAAGKPDCAAVAQNALDRTPVEVDEKL